MSQQVQALIVLLVAIVFSSVTNGQLPSTAKEQRRILEPALLNDKGGQAKGHRVSLRTRNGYYLRAKLGGGDNIVADVRLPKTSEVFVIEWLDATSIRLRTREGFYVGARMGGGRNIDAKTKKPGSSEVFRVEWQDEKRTRLRLRTREGYYVHPVRGGGDNVDACERTPKTSETLTMIYVSDA